MDISEEIVRKIRGEYVEARYSSVLYYDLNTREGKTIHENQKEGTLVRVVDQNRLRAAYVDSVDSLDRIDLAEKREVPAFCPPDPVEYHGKSPQPVELPTEMVFNVLETFENVAPANARMESLTVYEHVVTNRGTDVCHGTTKLFIRIFFTPVQETTLVFSCGSPGQDILKELERLNQLDLRAVSQQGSTKSGLYDVVLSPQVTGMLFHEVAHSFEGFCPSFSHVLPVTVSDHPGADRLGGYEFDSEGCRASSTTLIDNGEILGCLTSLLEPGSKSPTGNARASRSDVEPIPRQSNLEITGEECCREEELLEMVKDGVYISQVGESSTFPGGVTYFSKTVSYRIEKGEKTEFLRNISFGGNLVALIASIEKMGSNQKLEPAVCWKNSQRLFITTKAPSSLICNLPLVSSGSQRL
jgi:predicted Zn-dependent protease